MSLAVAFLVVVVVAASVPPNKRKHQPALAFLVVVLGAVFAGLTQWRHVWIWSLPKMTKTSVLLVAALDAASARLAASRMHLPSQRRAHAFLAAVLDVAPATEREPPPYLPRALQLAQPTDVKVVVYFPVFPLQLSRTRRCDLLVTCLVQNGSYVLSRIGVVLHFFLSLSLETGLVLRCHLVETTCCASPRTSCTPLWCAGHVETPASPTVGVLAIGVEARTSFNAPASVRH